MSATTGPKAPSRFIRHDIHDGQQVLTMRLLNKFEHRGVGCLWLIREILACNDGRIPWDDVMSGNLALSIHARSRKAVKEVVDYCIEQGLLFVDGEMLGCPLVDRDMGHVEQVSRARSEAARQRSRVSDRRDAASGEGANDLRTLGNRTQNGSICSANAEHMLGNCSATVQQEDQINESIKKKTLP